MLKPLNLEPVVWGLAAGYRSQGLGDLLLGLDLWSWRGLGFKFRVYGLIVGFESLVSSLGFGHRL